MPATKPATPVVITRVRLLFLRPPLFLAARHIAQASSSAEMRPSAPWYQTQTHHGALVCVTRLYAFLLKNQGPSCLPSFGILGDPNRTLVRAPLLAARTMRAGLPGKAHDGRTRRGPFVHGNLQSPHRLRNSRLCRHAHPRSQPLLSCTPTQSRSEATSSA